MMKLTKEYFERHPDFEHDSFLENSYREMDPSYSEYLCYQSLDGRIVVQNFSNLSDSAWNIHVDNECFESLASFDVETVEDANKVLGIYGMKI